MMNVFSFVLTDDHGNAIKITALATNATSSRRSLTTQRLDDEYASVYMI